MTPPINIDGTDITGGTIDGTDFSEVTVDGTTVFITIPDSVVTREADNSSAGQSSNALRGVRITTDVEFPEIDGRVSSQASGVNKAEIYRVSDGKLMGDADISSTSSGETFRIDLDVNLQPFDSTDSTRYNFVLTNDSSGYTQGFYDSPSFPYTSSDGNLSIVDGAEGTTGTGSGEPNCIDKVGNLL